MTLHKNLFRPWCHISAILHSVSLDACKLFWEETSVRLNFPPGIAFNRPYILTKMTEGPTIYVAAVIKRPTGFTSQLGGIPVKRSSDRRRHNTRTSQWRRRDPCWIGSELLVDPCDGSKDSLNHFGIWSYMAQDLLNHFGIWSYLYGSGIISECDHLWLRIWSLIRSNGSNPIVWILRKHWIYYIISNDSDSMEPNQRE